MKVEKKKVFTQVKEVLGQKISDLRTAIQEAKTSRDSDTKSSAGDKHETSRAMAQIEIENLEIQLQRVLQLEDILIKVRIDVEVSRGQLGALMTTDYGIYFLCIGLGPIEMNDGLVVYVVSPQSPIGNLLMASVQGDTLSFNDRDIHVLEVN